MFCSKKFLMAAVALMALATMFPAVSSAGPVTPDDLADLQAGGGENGNGTIIVGDKLFDFNGGSFSTVNTGGAAGPTAAQVFVLPEGANTFDPGIIFQSAHWNILGIQSIDTTFTFKVTSLAGPTIIDAEMNLQSFGARNGGSISITEALRDNTNALVGTLLVNSSSALFSSDHIFFPPQTTLTVSKDVSLTGSQENSLASLSTFDQRFSEIVPEPSTVVLLGLGVLGMVGYRWRRRGK